MPALSDKDEADLRFAMGLRADMVALSFVRNASDVDRVHAIMDEFGVAAAGAGQDREAAGRRQPGRRSSRPSTA